MRWLTRVYKIALLVPFIYIAYLILTGRLGADPAKHLNHRTGSMALYMLLGNLLIGILIAFRVRFPRVLAFLPAERRYLGVVSFCYLICHVFFYLLMESFTAKALTQIVTKTYLIFGVSAWLILATLAVTSNNFSVRKLGPTAWKKLHRLIYVANVLFTVHVMLIEKTDLIKYGSMLAFVWLLQGLRLVRWLRRPIGRPRWA